jgi:hypothetical protein
VRHAHGMHAYEVHDHKVYPSEMHAHEMHAREVHAYEMHAHEVHAYEMHACERYVPVRDISTREACLSTGVYFKACILEVYIPRKGASHRVYASHKRVSHGRVSFAGMRNLIGVYITGVSLSRAFSSHGRASYGRVSFRGHASQKACISQART